MNCWVLQSVYFQQSINMNLWLAIVNQSFTTMNYVIHQSYTTSYNYVEPTCSNMSQLRGSPSGGTASRLRLCPDVSLNCQRKRRWNTPVAQHSHGENQFPWVVKKSSCHLISTDHDGLVVSTGYSWWILKWWDHQWAKNDWQFIDEVPTDVIKRGWEILYNWRL